MLNTLKGERLALYPPLEGWAAPPDLLLTLPSGPGSPPSRAWWPLPHSPRARGVPATETRSLLVLFSAVPQDTPHGPGDQGAASGMKWGLCLRPLNPTHPGAFSSRRPPPPPVLALAARSRGQAGAGRSQRRQVPLSLCPLNARSPWLPWPPAAGASTPGGLPCPPPSGDQTTVPQALYSDHGP